MKDGHGLNNILKTGEYPDESAPIGSGTVKATTLNVRQGNGTYFTKTGTLQKNNQVTIYESIGSWYRIGKGEWVAKAYVTAQQNEPLPELTKRGIVNANRLNVRNGASRYHEVINQLQRGEEVTIYLQTGDWYHIGNNHWVHSAYVDIEENILKKGIVTASVLNVRSGAGTNQTIVGTVSENEVVSIYEERNGWYRISNDRWVSAIYILEMTKKIGKITANRLNVRSGPGVAFPVVDSLPKDKQITIEAEEGQWFRIAEGEWVHRNYVQLVEL